MFTSFFSKHTTSHARRPKRVLLIVSDQDGKPAFGPEKEYRGREVWLRLVVRGTKATGQFRSSENEPWQVLGERTIPTSAKELLVGLHSGYGQEKSGRQVRFRKSASCKRASKPSSPADPPRQGKCSAGHGCHLNWISTPHRHGAKSGEPNSKLP